MRIALIADAAKGVEEFYSREQIQTVIKPRLYPRPCQFLMKIIPVIKCVCACVRTSAEEDNCPREGGGCVYLMIFLFYFLSESLCFGLSEKALFQLILGLLGISIRSFL